MGIRARIVALSGLAVAVAVIAAAAGSYLAVRSELMGQIDDSLDAQAEVLQGIAAQGRIDQRPPGARIANRLPDPPQAAPPTSEQGPLVLRITRGGRLDQLPGSSDALPIGDDQRALARRGSGRLVEEVSVDGQEFRVLTVGVGEDGAVVLGRSLEGVHSVLEDLRLILALLALGGVGIATGLAFLVGRRVVAPIRRLTETAEHISATSDLRRRIDSEGSDEVARLASRFNAMLDTIAEHQQALERSVGSQRQLVADASHELRSPVAAIRTDIETVLAHPDLPVTERIKILASADERIEELTDLVLDVIELARGDDGNEGVDHVRLDLIAADSISRLRGLTPDREIRASLAPTVVEGRPDRLFRAINNLLDNASKYSPPDRPIEVDVADGAVEVRDHGPGIPEADLPSLFDRFWRGSSSRNHPGSGLGLAIVRQVADAGGGEVTVENLPRGGAGFRLAFPVSESLEPEPQGRSEPAARAQG